ncbi:AHH domain-containing protein [Flavobacterium columnare]|uniref:AHH domain-containing protein n=1 Tax=Flavobacterium columnare TaxID=996 RepID=UPI002D782CC8|nr:AHH domain-containing protein [Flavobacterium columnare]
MLGEEVYSIINDYLGTPVQAYNSNGKLIWERELDIYGKTRKIEGDQNLIPFLYQGQYYDHDIELAYNRFRYYNPETGLYLSQDPIGLAGNNPTFYGYVVDNNTHFDPFGLMPMPSNGWSYNNMPKIDGYQNHHVIPRSKASHPAIKAAGFDVDKPSNLIYLPKEQGTHPTRSLHNGWNKQHADYNLMIHDKLDKIYEKGMNKGWSQQKFHDEVSKLSKDTRKGLREDRIKCH